MLLKYLCVFMEEVVHVPDAVPESYCSVVLLGRALYAFVYVDVEVE